jgi:hypothetical protein
LLHQHISVSTESLSAVNPCLQGYATYIIIYYVLCSIILLLVAATMWLGQMLRKDDSIATQHKR